VSFRAVCRFKGPQGRCEEHFTDADLFVAHRWKAHRMHAHRYSNTAWDRSPTTYRVLTDAANRKPSELLGHLDLLVSE